MNCEKHTNDDDKFTIIHNDVRIHLHIEQLNCFVQEGAEVQHTKNIQECHTKKEKNCWLRQWVRCMLQKSDN